jgi:hypothetical protein
MHALRWQAGPAAIVEAMEALCLREPKQMTSGVIQ